MTTYFRDARHFWGLFLALLRRSHLFKLRRQSSPDLMAIHLIPQRVAQLAVHREMKCNRRHIAWAKLIPPVIAHETRQETYSIFSWRPRHPRKLRTMTQRSFFFRIVRLRNANFQ